MNAGFWNMDSGLAATRRPGMTISFVGCWRKTDRAAAYSTDSTHS